MRAEGRDGQRLSQVGRTSPSGAQNTLGEGKQKPPCGRLGRKGETNKSNRRVVRGGVRGTKERREVVTKRKRRRAGRERKGGPGE